MPALMIKLSEVCGGNRFKACIEEEEFPVFTWFNVVAVLLVLSVYYAVIIARNKNKR